MKKGANIRKLIRWKNKIRPRIIFSVTLEETKKMLKELDEVMFQRCYDKDGNEIPCTGTGWMPK